ncbi:MAG: hypothetical protein M1813_006616 [Trichoglossum hirsutum]|nr:MAG: hypothetical protein M1813_006616 [Trichoglossum hirsutum]
MSQDVRMSGNPTFEFIACSGATSEDVLKEQVPQLSSGYDLITLSAGGNDVGLTSILNACVFQWGGGNDQDCDNQLQATQNLIQNTLPQNLDNLLNSLKGKLSSGSKVYQTSYAKFFDTSDAQCNGVTWSFWYAGLAGGQKQYLTQARRQKMNDLADAANKAISDAISRAGSQFVFVDYDQYYTKNGGLFCDPGTKEPAPNRDGLLFYEWDTTDTNSLSRRQENSGLDPNQVVDGTFEGQIVAWANATMAKNPTAQTEAQHEGVQAGKVLISPSTFIPDGYLRVFHPRPEGHAIIANLVFWKLAETRAKASNQPFGPEVNPYVAGCLIDYCQLDPDFQDCWEILTSKISPSSTSPVPVSSNNHYQNATYEWYDLWTVNTCQLSIGWQYGRGNPL